MDSHKYKPTCHMVNNVMSDQSPVMPNYLSYYKSKRSISDRRVIVSPDNPESRVIEENSDTTKQPCSKAHRLTPRGSCSDLCLEDAQNGVNQSILTTALQDSVYEGSGLNYMYDTISNEKSLFASSEITSFAARDRVLESQQNVLFKKGHENGIAPMQIPHKNKSNCQLLSANDAGLEPRKSSPRLERVFGDSNDVTEYSGINTRLSSRKLFFAQENPRERNKESLNHMDIAECNHRYSYIDRSRNLFSISEKIMNDVQLTFPDKCGGNLELVSRAAGRNQIRQPQQDHEIYASYIPDHCRKNRRGKNSNKSTENSRKDQHEFDLNSSHKDDVGAASVSGKKANRSLFSNKEDDFLHTPLTSLYARRNANAKMLDENEELSYLTQSSGSNKESNKNSDKSFTGNRRSTENGSKSVDKSRRHRSCVFGDDLNEDSKSNRINQQSKNRAAKRRQRSFLKETPCYIQSTYSKRQPYNECKKNKPWRASSKEKPDGEQCCPEIKRNEIPSDYNQWRAQLVPNSLNTEDILSRPPWTCTKWTSEVFTDRRQKPPASKWAYEVYSDTCLRASNEDLSTDTNSKACTDVNEELCTLEISNENLQERQLGPDFLNHVLCVNNLAVHGVDYSRRMIRCSTVLAARQKARITPHLVANCNPLNHDQTLSESNNPSQEMCLQFQTGQSDDILGAIRERKCIDSITNLIRNVKSIDDPVKIDPIDRNNQKEEPCNTGKAERENVSTGVVHKIIRNDNICIKQSASQIAANSDGRKTESARSMMFPIESQCSVDEKLARTVHAIKEDIDGVFNRLGTIDANTNQTVTKPVLKFQDEAIAVVNKATDTEEDGTVTKANMAVEVVKCTAAKLAVLSSTFGTSSSNEEDNQNNMSYDLYKAGKEKYNDGTDKREYDYDITVFPIDCAKQRNSNLQQVFNPVFMETSAMPVVARTLSDGGKCSRQEEIYMLIKEDSEMKENQQNSRSSSLQLLTENNEQSASESSDCITISENNMFPSTTDSRVSHKSSRKLLVAKYTENRSNISSDDLGDDFSELPQSATSDADVSPQMQRTLQSVPTNEAGVPPTRNRKRRKGSLTNRIKKKFLEMFDYSSNVNKDSNERTSQTKSGKKRKNIIKDIEISLNNTGSSENQETHTINKQNIKSNPAAENNPNIFLGTTKSLRKKSTPHESTIGSPVSSMPTIDDENWSLSSSPPLIKNISDAGSDTSETSGSESTAKPMSRETRTKRKSVTKNKRTSKYPYTRTHDVQIVYKLRSKTALTESESPFTNTLTVKPKKETGEMSTKQKNENGRFVTSGLEGDYKKDNENQGSINKPRLSTNDVSAKNTPTRNAESSDEYTDKLKNIPKSNKSSYPKTNKYISTRPHKKAHIYERNNYIIECVEKCNRNKSTMKELQGCDKKDSSMTSLLGSYENSEASNKEQNISEKINPLIPNVRISDTTSESTTSSAKHFSKKLRPNVQGRRISRKRVELKLRKKELMDDTQTSDTSSLSTFETSITKRPDTTQKAKVGLQSPTQVLNKTSTANEKYVNKHIMEKARNNANEILLKLSKVQPAKKLTQSKQGKEKETASKSPKTTGVSVTEEVQSAMTNNISKKGESKKRGLARKMSPDKEHSPPSTQTKQNNALVEIKDSSENISASQLNMSIMKLYEEINKLRAQLEASTEDIVSRQSPPRNKLSTYGVVSPSKEILKNRELSPKTSDRSTSMSFSSYREYKSASESADIDATDDRYFGSATVIPKDPEYGSSMETIQVSRKDCESVCCLYRKYSGENKHSMREYLVDRNETDTAESSFYADHLPRDPSGLENNVTYFESKQKSPKCYSEVTNGGERECSDYWAEQQNLAAAAGDFFDDTDVGPDGVESLDEDNDGLFGTVSSLDHGLETDKSGESKFQEYIFNNLPLHAGNGRAYARGIFPTAALESKQSASQIGSLSKSQYNVSGESTSRSKGSADNEMQCLLKCKMEPSQPDLWPHRFVFTNNNTLLTKGTISTAITKCIEELEGQKIAAVNVSTDKKEENSNLKSSSLELENKLEFDSLDDGNVTKRANVHTNVLHFDDITKLRGSPPYASLAANPSTSANEQSYTSSAKNKQRRSPKEKPAPANMSFESNSMPMWSDTEESPITSKEDYIPPSHVPRIVQCVRDMLFGSTKAETKESFYENPELFDRPRTSSRMKYSPTSEAKCSDSRKRTSNDSEQQYFHNEYVNACNETQGKSNCQNEFSKGSNSPKLENCTFKGRLLHNIAESGSSVDKSHRIPKQRPVCDIEKINERSPCYSEELWHENEEFSSYIIQNSFTTSQSSNSRTSPKSDFCKYSPKTRECEKADMVIRHYSDAINANGSKGMLGREPNLANNSNVSSANQMFSERCFPDLTSNDNKYMRTFDEGVGYSNYERSSKMSNLDRVNDTMSSKRAAMDAEWNGRDINSSADKSRMGEKRRFASFENMLQQGQTCYVEHCGFRHKRVETEYCRNDELSGIEGEIMRNEEENIQATREQVSNDNNYSDLVKEAGTNGVQCEFPANFGHENGISEGNENLCKRSDMFDVINFHEDKHMLLSISRNDDYSTDSGRSDDCGNNNQLSNCDHVSDVHENTEINDVGEFDDEENENEDAIDERETILNATDEMPENFSDDENNEANISTKNFSDDENNEANISTRNTTFDEDEKENWYKTTDEESNI